MSRITVIVAVALTAVAVAVMSRAPLPATAKPKTLKFTSHTLSEKGLSRSSFVSYSVDKAGGKVIGYDVLSGSFDRKRNTGHFDVAVALDGGFLYATFDVEGDATDIQGKLTGGSGDYEDVSGTVDVVDADQKTATITVHFE